MICHCMVRDQMEGTVMELSYPVNDHNWGRGYQFNLPEPSESMK